MTKRAKSTAWIKDGARVWYRLDPEVPGAEAREVAATVYRKPFVSHGQRLVALIEVVPAIRSVEGTFFVNHMNRAPVATLRQRPGYKPGTFAWACEQIFLGRKVSPRGDKGFVLNDADRGFISLERSRRHGAERTHLIVDDVVRDDWEVVQ